MNPDNMPAFFGGPVIILCWPAHQRFSLKSIITPGFLLKCGAFRSPNPQRFDGAFNAILVLMSTALIHFLTSIAQRRAHSWLNLLGVLNAWRAKTEYTLACAQAVYFSPMKPEKYPVKILMTMNDTQIEVGKYLVSPTAKVQGEGCFAASVSIRSGHGSGTHDRVLRFSRIFDSAGAAVHYATEHALVWIRESSSPICA